MARLLLLNNQWLDVQESLARIETQKLVADEQLLLHRLDGSGVKLGRRTILDIRDRLS